PSHTNARSPDSLPLEHALGQAPPIGASERTARGKTHRPPASAGPRARRTQIGSPSPAGASARARTDGGGFNVFAPKINPKLIALGAAGTIALAASHAAADTS